jgi:hypothetical protein
MHRLHLRDRRGVLRYLGLDVVAEYIAESHGGGTVVLAEDLIFRNEWKAGAQFRD